MSPEEKQLLEKTFILVEENNKILRKINRAVALSIAWKAFYWLAIIGLSFGAYYFIQPYIDTLKGALSDIGSSAGDLNSLINSN